MIRFAAEGENGHVIIGVGLSRENWNQLLAGNPISFDMGEMGGKGRIFIMAGETEQAMYEILHKNGLIDNDGTIVRDTREKRR